MIVLACDLGGTTTRVQLADVEDGAHSSLIERDYASAAYSDLLPILQDFLSTAPSRPSAACFAVAGPVMPVTGGQQASITNLPWELDSRMLARALGLERLTLINDFEAVGYGIEALRAEDLTVLQAGSARPGAPRAVLGAGTGLGEALLFWHGDHYQVIPSEGGHVEFGPTDEQQVALLRYVRDETGHVSYERLLSGGGLVRIFEFLRDDWARIPEGPSLRDALRTQDPAAAISEHALNGGDALAVQALDLFVRIYGAQAGNLALTCMARGGVYLAGGIAPKIIDRLTSGPFLTAFRSKGRHSILMSEFPVYVIRNPRVGLLGAARVAASHWQIE